MDPHLVRVERLREVVRHFKVSKKQLMQPTGFSYASIAGKTKFPSDKVAVGICSAWGISYNWLMRGVGQMLEKENLQEEKFPLVPATRPLPIEDKEIIDVKGESFSSRTIPVDFSDCPNVFFSLLKLSKDMFRTPQQQILWIVSNFIKENGDSNGSS